MVAHDKLLKIIDGVYEAALQPQRWNDVLGRVKRAFGASDVLMHAKDFADVRQTFMFEASVPEEALRAYLADGGHYLRIDPRFEAGRGLSAGAILHEKMFISEREMERHECYEFFGRFDMWWSLNGVLANAGHVISALTIHRPRRPGPPPDEHIKAFRSLVPHFQRALLLQNRFESLVRDDAFAAFEELSQAIVIVDGDCRIRTMNRAARRVIGTADGLISTRDGLRGTDASGSTTLRRIVAEVLSEQSNAARAPKALRVMRPSGRPDLVAQVTPLRTTSPILEASSDKLAAVFVSEPDQPPAGSWEALAVLYGLTRREAQLGQHLAAGRSLDDAADALRITRESARTYLKRIQAKAGAARQTELVRLLLQAVGPIPRANGANTD